MKKRSDNKCGAGNEGQKATNKSPRCLLAEICRIKTGKKDVNQGNPNGKYPFFTCAKNHTYSDSYSYDMEAILLAGNGHIGNPILYRGKFEAYQRTYILYDFKGVDAEYLNYFLGKFLGKKINQEKQEGVMPYIKLETLQMIAIAAPSLKKQKRIGEILRACDAAIEKIEALSNAKERLFARLTKKSIYRSNHEKKRLSGFIEEVSKRNRENKISRVLSVTNNRGFVLPEEQFSRRVASANVTNYKIVRKNQYAYNPARINVGSIARLDKWNDGVLSPMYIVFKLDNNIVDSDYFLHWLSSNEAKQRIKKSAQGSVRQVVGFDDLGAISIPLPDLATQEKLSTILNDAKQEIALLKKLAEQYRLQKRGLMQKLLSEEPKGKIATT